jgi:hypothetical protein
MNAKRHVQGGGSLTNVKALKFYTARRRTGAISRLDFTPDSYCVKAAKLIRHRTNVRVITYGLVARMKSFFKAGSTINDAMLFANRKGSSIRR